MKKIVFLILSLAFIVLNAYADAVEINGIYYNLIDKARTAEVTKNPNGYNGDIVIPSKVEYEGVVYDVSAIGERAFQLNKKIKTVKLPSSISVIKYAAFDSSSLTSIEMSNGIETIEEYAFNACSYITSIFIPSSVKKIGSLAFAQCGSLTSVSITDFDSWCKIYFDNIYSNPLHTAHHMSINGKEITKCEFPKGISNVDYYQFAGWSALEEIVIPNGVESIGVSAFSGCSGLKSINLPNSINSISTKAFEGCSKLKDIVIPNGVTRIESGSFKNCDGLETLTIGKGVASIYGVAFENCIKLIDVTCLPSTVISLDNTAFGGSYLEYATLHVPDSLLNAYKTSASWSKFGRIVSISGDEPKKCETPKISYNKGELNFTCATDNAEFVTEITNSDIKKHYDSKVKLSATYTIKVYATATGYENSDIVTATLCWIETEPKAEGIESGVANVRANPVLVQNNGSIITVSGNIENIPIYIYDVSGRKMGEAIGRNGIVDIDTRLMTGDVAIVKIADKSVKVLLK